jgi:hypothetical protein
LHGPDRLHHFIGAGMWDASLLEAALWRHADQMLGGADSWLIIDDIAMPKQDKGIGWRCPSIRLDAGARHMPRGGRGAGGRASLK